MALLSETAPVGNISVTGWVTGDGSLNSSAAKREGREPELPLGRGPVPSSTSATDVQGCDIPRGSMLDLCSGIS